LAAAKVVAEVMDGCARFDRLPEISEIQDLLDDYAAGSLYMSDVIGRQGPDTREGSDQ